MIGRTWARGQDWFPEGPAVPQAVAWTHPRHAETTADWRTQKMPSPLSPPNVRFPLAELEDHDPSGPSSAPARSSVRLHLRIATSSTDGEQGVPTNRPITPFEQLELDLTTPPPTYEQSEFDLVYRDPQPLRREGRWAAGAARRHPTHPGPDVSRGAGPDRAANPSMPIHSPQPRTPSPRPADSVARATTTPSLKEQYHG